MSDDIENGLVVGAQDEYDQGEVDGPEYTLREQLFDTECPGYYTDHDFSWDAADFILPEDMADLRAALSNYVWAHKRMQLQKRNPSMDDVATRGAYFTSLQAEIGRIIGNAAIKNTEGK